MMSIKRVFNWENKRSAFRKLVGSILKRNKKDKFKKLPCIRFLNRIYNFIVHIT